MDPFEADRWHDLKRVVALALDAAPGERQSVLEIACAGDEELLSYAKVWIATDSDLPPHVLDGQAPARLSETAAESLIGPYLLEEEVGRGGMGVVYRAIRQDAYAQQVAIKILNAYDSADLRARFEQERQILARLNHPNIARILDGGTTSEGRLYFVMELVQGQPITVWARAKQRTLSEVVSVLIAVCEAVQYAHRNLVVHRDLKPENILVSDDNVPKLLDFGIAKALQENPGGEALTAVAAPLTPEYASPEQMLGLPVTTSSDQYSLGLILFELIAGKRLRHFPSREWPAMVSTITTTDPTRLNIDADLEAIAGKALRQEPAERYETVAALIEDLSRWTRGEAIVARKQHRWYQIRKLIRQQRWAIAAAAAIIFALAFGLTIANRERVRAEKNASSVRQLANTYLFEIHEKIQNLSGSLPAQRVVVETALRYLEGLRKDAGTGDPELLHDVADGYLRIGLILGGAVGSNLGLSDQAASSFQTAVELGRQYLAARPGIRAQRLMVRALQQTSALSDSIGRTAEARRDGEEAYRLCLALTAAEPANPANAVDLVRSLEDLGYIEQRQRRREQAIGWYELAAKAGLEAIARHPNHLKLLGNTASVHHLKASMHGEGGQLDKALDSEQVARSLAERGLALDAKNIVVRRQVAEVNRGLGRWLLMNGQDNRVLPYFEEALRMSEALAAENPQDMRSKRDLGQSLTYLVTYHVSTAEPAPAIPLARRRMAIAAELAGANPKNKMFQNDLLVARSNLSEALLASGDNAGAMVTLREASELARKMAASSKYAEYMALVFGRRMAEASLRLNAILQARQYIESTRKELLKTANGKPLDNDLLEIEAALLWISAAAARDLAPATAQACAALRNNKALALDIESCLAIARGADLEPLRQLAKRSHAARVRLAEVERYRKGTS